jgi:hypothetical protein
VIKNNWRWLAWSLLIVGAMVIADEVSRLY